MEALLLGTLIGSKLLLAERKVCREFTMLFGPLVRQPDFVLCAEALSLGPAAGAAGGEEEEEKQEEEKEEEEDLGARPAKGRRQPPRGPGAREREEHNLTHLPYRSWCPA